MWTMGSNKQSHQLVGFQFTDGTKMGKSVNQAAGSHIQILRGISASPKHTCKVCDAYTEAKPQISLPQSKFDIGPFPTK